MKNVHVSVIASEDPVHKCLLGHVSPSTLAAFRYVGQQNPVVERVCTPWTEPQPPFVVSFICRVWQMFVFSIRLLNLVSAAFTWLKFRDALEEVPHTSSYFCACLLVFKVALPAWPRT